MKLNAIQKKKLRAAQLAAYEIADNAGTVESFTIVGADGFIYETKDGVLVPKTHNLKEDLAMKGIGEEEFLAAVERGSNGNK